MEMAFVSERICRSVGYEKIAGQLTGIAGLAALNVFLSIFFI